MCVGSDLAGEHDVLPVVAVAVVDPLGLVVALLYPGLAARARPRLVEVYPYRPGARPLHIPGALGGPPAPDLGPGVAQQPAEHVSLALDTEEGYKEKENRVKVPTCPKLVEQTVPQTPLWRTSSRPDSPGGERRTWVPELQRAGASSLRAVGLTYYRK